MVNSRLTVCRRRTFKKTKLSLLSLLDDLIKTSFLAQKSSISFAIELSEKFFDSLNPIRPRIKGEINDFDQNKVN
jgi:hypothetical protein